MFKYHWRHLLVPLCVTTTACTTVTVDTFEQWCEYVHSTGERAASFAMDTDAVIAGLVDAWDVILVSNNASVMGVPQESVETDAVLAELRQGRTVGAWRAGDTINVAVGVIPSPVAGPTGPDDGYFADSYRTALAAVNASNAGDTMDPLMYCLYRGIDIFFAELLVNTATRNDGIKTEAYHRLKALR